jgi:hypothetical protein
LRTLLYVNILKGILEREAPSTVYAIGRTPVVSIARFLAAKRGIDFQDKTGVGSGILAQMASRGMMAPYRTPYRSISRYLLSLLPCCSKKVIFSEPKKRRRILFVGWIDRTVERLVAAAPMLREEMGADFHFLSVLRVSLTDSLRRAGFSCSYVHDWMKRKEGTALMRTVDRAAARGWDKIQKNEKLFSRHRWQGVPIFPYVAPVLKRSCLDGASFSSYFVEIAARAIEQAQPDMVVCLEEWEIQRAITLLCRQKNIPTVAYNTLSGIAYDNVIRRSQDWMAVTGKVLYRGFEDQYKEKKERLCVIGDTLVDRAVLSSKEESRRKVCSDLGLSLNKPLVLLLSTYATSPVTMKDIEILFKKTAQAVKCIPGAQLIIKTHPLQPAHDVRCWIKLWGCGAKVVDQYSLFSLCQAADIVSAPITSAVWQAMLAKTPVVCIQHKELLEKYEGMGYDYLENKGIFHISPTEDALPIFEKLIFDPKTRESQIQRGLKHAEEHMGPVDGQATQRLVTFLNSILTGSRA